MEKFEKLIKDAVNGYEAPYSADTWQSLNKKLGPAKGSPVKWFAGAAAVITLIIVGYNILTPQTSIIVDKNKANSNINLKTNNDVAKINDITAKKTQTSSKTEQINQKSDNIANTVTTVVNSIDKPVHISNIEDANRNDNFATIIDINFEENLANISEQISDIENNDLNSNVTLNYKAIALVDNTTKCKSETFKFTPSVPKQKVIYEWDLGDGTIKTGGYISHKYESAGSYNVMLTLRDIKTLKVLKQSPEVEVSVLALPQNDFTFEHSNGIVPKTIFKTTLKPQTNIQWEIVGLRSDNNEQFTYSFKQKGNYVVKLSTTAENGCRTTATKIVKIKNDYNLLAPTAFSPNDDYLNDKFIPKALPLLNLPFTMTIYDRQGRMVYQTTDSNNPWDGLYTKDGIAAPNGVYIWIVQLTTENGVIEQYQDQITIAR